MRIVIVVQYDGTHFCGWQVQPEKRTVQGELENAVFTLTGEKSCVIASGRTDSGVHARAQVAHFDLNASSVPPENFRKALNVLLPPDLKVVRSYLAPEGFHARFSAKKKTYVYRFYKSAVELPILSRYACRIEEFTDVQKMSDAAGLLVGKHDFGCFMSTGSPVKDTIREIYSCTVSQKGNEVTLEVCGNGFLYNMVRAIAGTLYAAGLGRINGDDVVAMLRGGSRSSAGKTMPPQGLELKEVVYDSD